MRTSKLPKIFGLLILSYLGFIIAINLIFNRFLLNYAVNKLISPILMRNIVLGPGSDLTLSPKLYISLKLKNTTLQNASWSAAGQDMLTIDEATIKLNPYALIYKKINITNLNIKKANIILDENSTHKNWDFAELNEKAIDAGKKEIEGRAKYKIIINKLDLNEINIKKYYTSKKQTSIVVHRANNTYLNAENFLSLDAHLEQVPIKLTTKITRNLTRKKYYLQIEDGHIGDSDLSGTLELMTKPFNLSGTLESKVLTNTKMVQALKTLSKDSVDAKTKASYSLPSTKLPLSTWQDYILDISYHIKKLKLNDLIVNDLKLVLQKKEANPLITLAVDENVKIARGKLNFSATLDTKNKKFKLESKAQKVLLADVVNGIRQQDVMRNGSMYAKLKLHTSGDVLSQMVRKLNGRLYIKVQEGIYNSNLKILSESLFFTILKATLPRSKKSSSTKFDCFILNSKIDAGVLNIQRGIGFETKDLNMLGSGKFDLYNGNIRLTIEPQSKSFIDLGNTNITSALKVSGNIMQPKIGINPIGIAKKGTNITASIMSGGISNLFSGIVKAGTSFSACKVANEQ